MWFVISLIFGVTGVVLMHEADMHLFGILGVICIVASAFFWMDTS